MKKVNKRESKVRFMGFELLKSIDIVIRGECESDRFFDKNTTFLLYKFFARKVC